MITVRCSLILALAILFSFYAITVSAAQITFQREYTYQASEIDSKLSCRTIALEQVKRLLLEELGVYIVSTFEDRCTREDCATKNEIITLTAGIVQTEIISEKWDGHTYWLKAKIVADPNEVMKSVAALRKDRFVKETLERQKKESQELLTEIERLKNELSLSRESVQKGNLAKHKDTVQKLSANDWFEKGSVCYRSGEYQLAIEFLNNAIGLNPNKVLFYLQRSAAYGRLAKECLQNKRYDEAIKAYQLSYKDSLLPIEIEDRLIESFAAIMQAQACNGLAYAYGKMRKGDEESFYCKLAILSSKLSIDLYPSSDGYLNLGFAYLRNNRFRGAIKAFNKAIHLDREFEPAYITRFDAYNRYLCSQGVDQNSPVQMYPSEQAAIFYKDGKYNESIEAYNEAIELDPEDAYSYHCRALCYLELKNYRQALRDLDKAIELDPRDRDAYVRRSTIFAYQLGNYEQAIRDINRYMKLVPEWAGGYMVRCNYHFMFDNYQKAIRDCNKAIELDPAIGGFYWVRAKVYYGLGDYRQAINDCKVAARLGEKEAQNYLKSEGIKY